MRALLVILVFTFFSCKPSKQLSQQKKIQTTTYKVDCAIVSKKIKPTSNKTYYWYKSNEIHKSKGGYSGDLLHGNYVKYYITNELQEKGIYEKGLKTGLWKTWFIDGSLKEIQRFKNGLLKGDYLLYDAKGDIITKGVYKKGKKSGTWINYKTQDTTSYKKGKVLVKAKAKKSLFNKWFKKKDSIVEKGSKVRKHNAKKKKETSQKEKRSFLKRLFEKKENSNVKS